jgi:pyruvate,orthophosphate dikinase
MKKKKRWVYSFGKGKAAGHAGRKDLLGGKGANLAEMTRLGIPVPPGFTISTEACQRFFKRKGKLPEHLREQVQYAMTQLEKDRGKRFGDDSDPLLVSVRSGAKFSMPGMMDTILNLGLNDTAVRGLAEITGDARFAWDSYRRLIQMYADVVLETGKEPFESELKLLKIRRKVKLDTDLSAADLQALCKTYLRLVKKYSGEEFPQQAADQLWGSVSAVFRSWDNDRARLYRRNYGISDALGTAVNIQCMVFGNLGHDCATGVAFTRDPATGANVLYGEWLPNAQGEDVVAGIRTPLPISELETSMPAPYRELQKIRGRLERHYGDMQDVEFTIERGKLYMLQTRTGKRTGMAALHIAFDFHRSRRIGREDVVARVEPEMLDHLLAPVFSPREEDQARRDGRLLGRGLPAGPGAACGRLTFSAKKAEEMAASGEDALLARAETSPEDLAGMVAAKGILTIRGGMTSHAAVVARGMGKPCVVGAESIRIDERRRVMKAGKITLREGDPISIDGSTGEVFAGRLEPTPSEIHQQMSVRKSKRKLQPNSTAARFQRLMRWADQIRRLEVRTNADTPHDATVARAFGAEGIGLCRTEHMFFAEERLMVMREMILSEDQAGRERALKKLLPMQRRDFYGIFKAMDGLPVTIRLLDPPLHEFLPTEPSQFRALAGELGVSARTVEETAHRLEESNPMLGHRGCRLGVTFPRIYEMQVRAIIEAALRARKAGIRVHPEIMIPLVGTPREFEILQRHVHETADRVMREKKATPLEFSIGTMMEVPRACLCADEIARSAQFFSFGTNDLTQMTFGFSRDDVAKFLPEYLERRILPRDPFESLDNRGVGRLVRLAVEEGRQSRPDIKIGICGEHGGDPESVGHFHRIGLDYVSCSPYRVPVARLAAAHAVLQEGGGAGSGTS